MFKKGFTLAEVLITLGIVGVIAAITLPTLVQDTTAAQVGPKLAKAVSTFEQANKALLNNEGVDLLTDTGLMTSTTTGTGTESTTTVDISNYLSKLSDHAMITVDAYSLDSHNWHLSKDGIAYQVDWNTTPSDTTLAAHKQLIGTVIVDINGENNPNTDGEDRFYFSFWNDGSLRPKGGTNWDGTDDSKKDGDEHWTKKCPANAVPTEYSYCAGHVFENNLKVLYN